MANFCKNCGAPLEGRRYCMNCGTLNEEPSGTTVANDQETTQSAAPSYTVVSSSGKKSGPNWLLIGGLLLVLVATICIVVSIVNKRERPYTAMPTPSLSENTPTVTDGHSNGTFDWSEVPGNFNEANLEEAVTLLFPHCSLRSYDALNYNSIDMALTVQGCRIQVPEDSIIDFSDVKIDISIDLTSFGDDGNYWVGDRAYYGNPVLKRSESFTVKDDRDNTLEVYYESNSYAEVQDGYIVLRNICIADYKRADATGISDPSFYVDLYLRPYYVDNIISSYTLTSLDGEYLIYLNSNFCPNWFSGPYSDQYNY